MQWLNNLFTSEKRSAEPAVIVKYPGADSDTDDVVVYNELALSAVITCVNKRANTLSSMPVGVYRTMPDGHSELVSDHPLTKLFKVSPYAGNEMTTVDWLHFGQLNFDYRGNFYAQIVRDNGGRIVEIIPIPSDSVSPYRNTDGHLLYRVGGLVNGRMETSVLSPEQVLHVRNISTDGVVGQSVLSLAKETVINPTAELNATSRRINKSTCKAPNVLTTAAALNQEAIDILKAQIGNGRNGTIILPNGMTFADRKVMISAEDAQFIQTYSFRSAEIAAMFDIPAYFLNIQSDRKPASSVDQDMQFFIRNTMLHIVERWEAAMNMRLLTDAERKVGLHFKFDETELLRLDSKSLMEYMVKGVSTGIFTINEMRLLAGYPSIEGGDTLRIPLNTGVPNDVK